MPAAAAQQLDPFERGVAPEAKPVSAAQSAGSDTKPSLVVAAPITKRPPSTT